MVSIFTTSERILWVNSLVILFLKPVFYNTNVLIEKKVTVFENVVLTDIRKLLLVLVKKK